MWQFDSRFSKAFNVLKESSRGANANYGVFVIMALKIQNLTLSGNAATLLIQPIFFLPIGDRINGVPLQYIASKNNPSSFPLGFWYHGNTGILNGIL